MARPTKGIKPMRRADVRIPSFMFRRIEKRAREDGITFSEALRRALQYSRYLVLIGVVLTMSGVFLHYTMPGLVLKMPVVELSGIPIGEPTPVQYVAVSGGFLTAFLGIIAFAIGLYLRKVLHAALEKLKK